MILYQNEGIESGEYIENLKKILNFCELYKIPNVLLKKDDLKKQLTFEEYQKLDAIVLSTIFKNPEIKIKKKELQNLKEQLGFYYNVKEKMEEEYFFVDTKRLREITKKLESKRIDKEVLKSFSFIIKDNVVKKAIVSFFNDNDKEKLEKIIHQRLTMVLNDNSSYKEKKYGKVLQNITIIGEKVRIEVWEEKGNRSNNSITSLYNYFEVQNYESLLKKIEVETEEKESLVLTALYLYLVQEKELKVETHKNDSFISLYDYFYKAYLAKKEKKIKKIPGLYLSIDRFLYKWFMGIIYVLTYYNLIFITIFTLKYGYKFLSDPVVYKEEVSLESIATDFKYYKYPFKFAFELEKCLIDANSREIKEILSSAGNDLSSNIEDALKTFFNKMGSFSNKERTSTETTEEKQQQFQLSGMVGDAKNQNEKERLLAEVTPLKENIEMPNYFAYSHAFDSCYFDGEKIFKLSARTIDSLKFYEADPLFSVNYAISKHEIEGIIFYDILEFWNAFYPVDDNYVLTAITITDSIEQQKSITWNKTIGITEEEKEVLSSMTNPEITYTYGIRKDVENAFVNEIKRIDYNYANSSNEIKEAIKRGLELEKDASIEEVFKAIKSKYYSTTPIKDENLTEEIKTMGEVEYFEAIASLDSLVCNMAATLAVETDDTLVYTAGFLNVNDEYITSGEAHAWAMSKDGKIIDITPTKKESKKIMEETTEKIMAWGIENSISLLGIALLIRYIMKKKYGKKIVFQFRMRKAEKLLERPNLAKSYANLNTFLYGRKSSPVKMTSSEWLETIESEFYASKKEDLQALKRELLQTKRFKNRYLKTTIDLMNQIPFVVENKEELQRNLEKKYNKK